MTGEDCRRKSRHYLAIALQMRGPDDRTAMIDLASFWMERAEEAERDKRIQQTQPEERS